VAAARAAAAPTPPARPGLTPDTNALLREILAQQKQILAALEQLAAQ
jgi:hypothetical protein